MTIVVFLVDTSASMHQRACLSGRTSILDVAKNAVETFIKVRQRIQESRGDRYMLLSFEEPPNNIKSGFKENLNTFKNELKNLQCLELTTMGSALKNTFDVLNLNRMQTGIDTYGQGRCPFYLEPSVIILITDGGKYSSTNGDMDGFNLPMHNSIPGSELTREPFRWDQRLYALVLRLSGVPTIERVEINAMPSDNSPINAMCEVTGGRSYSITSHLMMMNSIDNLVQKVQSGVVINFERINLGPDNEELLVEDNIEQVNENLLIMNWQSCRKMIYVPRSAQKGFAVGFWPIPESFWPDMSLSSLPSRQAHPNVRFTCTNQEPMIIDNLPFDKYELEPCSLVQYILARKQSTTCWQVFIANSYKNPDVFYPFGYLKASTNLTCVNLFVLPYNYPVLLPLLDELFKDLRLKSTLEWNQKFRNYLGQMPSYYAGPLRRALTRMGVPNSLISSLIPESYETTLSLIVLNYLKRVKKQAKIEFDRLCNDVLNKQNNNQLKFHYQPPASIPPCVRVLPQNVVKDDILTHPDYYGRFTSMNEQLNDFGGYVVGLPAVLEPHTNKRNFRNPYNTHRTQLLEQVVRLRGNFLQSLNRMKLVDDDDVHSLPISEMGNYQEYLKRMPLPLREIENTPVRRHMFGNPFKIDKRMMVDEADIDLMGGTGGGGSSTNTSKNGKRYISETGFKQLPVKRKPGPIPKNYKFEPSIITPVTSTQTYLPDEKDEKSNKEITSIETENNKSKSTDEMKSVESITQDFDKQMTFDVDVQRKPLKIINEISQINDQSSAFSNCNTTTSITKNLLSHHYNQPNKIENSNAMDLSDNNHENINSPAKNSEIYRNSIQYHNLKTKQILFTDVRTPGKDYRNLFVHLKLLRGEFQLQEAIIKQVYNEALRFKRAKLAREIINYLQLFRSELENVNSFRK